MRLKLLSILLLQTGLTFSILFAQSYASMYAVNHTQAVTGWTNLAGFTSTNPIDRSSDWTFDGNGTLTASSSSNGLYLVSFSISFSGSVTGSWEIGISLNDINPNSISIIRYISSAGDQGNASASGYLNITSGQTIKLKIYPPSNGNVTVNYAQVTLARLSDISGFDEYAEAGLYNNTNFQSVSSSWQNLTSTSPGFVSEHLSSWTHNNGILTASGTNSPGTYLVSANFSFGADKTPDKNLNYYFGISQNDGIPIQLIGGRLISNANKDVGNVSITGLLQVSLHDSVRIKVKAATSGSFIVTNCHISLIKISGGTLNPEAFPYASMYQYSQTPTAQSLAQGVATQLTGYLNDVTDPNYWMFSNNQLNPIGVSAGIYRINYFVSYSTDVGQNKLIFKVYNGNTELPDLTISRSTTNASDRGAAAGNGIIQIASASDLIRVMAISDKAANLSLYRSRLTLSRIQQTSSTPLPVELTSFTASIIGSKVKLNWQTATEVNNYGFDVERQAHTSTSLSVTEWEKIGFVNGNGNSSSPKSYSFIDDKALSGKYSYRLKQIDNDGQFEYSKNIEVDLGTPKTFELNQNYPNPFNPTTIISYNLPEAANVKLTIFNILGQEIKTLVNEYKEAGTHKVEFNASELDSGLYIYRLQAGSRVQTRKMTLIK
jgi:hypothetical protein